jgi:predicted peroxiredoxin
VIARLAPAAPLRQAARRYRPAIRRDQNMPDNGRVIVSCTNGAENPDGVVVSYLTAGAALDAGKDVVMWLTSEGVRLALRGYVDPIREGQEPPVRRVHDQFIEKGGRFYVCPICFNERALDEKELVDNAELKGATPLMEFAGEGAMTFSY